MSTERARGAFLRRFSLVAVLLLAVGIVGAAVSLTQGPRVSAVQVDPNAAISESGARVVLTLNQSVAPIDASAVTISPDAAYTLDVSGRTVGVRFTHPLDEATDYTVSIAGVQSVSGGPTSDITTSFRTPTAPAYVLQRGTNSDEIVRTEVAADAGADAFFQHEHIEDFRYAGGELLVSVVEDDAAHLLVVNEQGETVRELPLPGEGRISDLQVADRGRLIGYVYSDNELSETSGRASVLFFADLDGGQARAVTVAGEETHTDEWQFVPDATGALFIDWNGSLLLTDATSDAEPTNLGSAVAIDGIAHGTYEALVQQLDGWVLVDLTTGVATEVTLPDGVGTKATTDAGVPLTSDVVLWPVTKRDDAGLPLETTLVRVAGDAATDLLTLPTQHPILKVCASPSGDRLAVTVVPDIVGATYDGHQQPLPQSVETRIVWAHDGSEIMTIRGFSHSWCAEGPWR